MSRLENASRNVFWGIINKSVAILGPFIMRTIILYQLGAEYVGLSGVFTSLLQVLNFAELGFANAIVYSMYKPVAEGDTASICALLNYFRKIYKIISGLILILGIMIIPFLPRLISGTIPDGINLYILYIMYLINLISGYFLYAYKSSILLANQRNDIDSSIQMFFNILMYLVQGIVLLLFKNYYLYIVLIPVCTILVNFYRNYIVNKMYPEIRCTGYPDIVVRNEIVHKVMALAGHKIGLPITNSIDSLVVSATLGLTVLAVYDNYSYVFQAVGTVLTICYTSITPTIGNSIITRSVEKNYETFLTLSFVNLWVVSWCSISLLVLYQNFMILWVGDSLLLANNVVIALGIAFYVAYMRFITTTYKDACGMWEEDKLKPYVICIGNLILDLFCVKVLKLGVLGVIITTLFLRIVVAMPWETTVLFRDYFNRNASEYIKLLFKWAGNFAISSIITLRICQFVCGNNYGVISLIKRALVVIFIPNIIFIFLTHRSTYFKQIIQISSGMVKTRKKNKHNG